MLLNKITNRVLKIFEISRITTTGKQIFITFDDGPEGGITEFVLETLDKYGFKATFFCRGDNAEKNQDLLEDIRRRGHILGNHTYSHIHGFTTPSEMYIDDVEKANSILRTLLFRPPWGCLSLSEFIKLRKKYKIIYWSLESGDTEREKFDLAVNLGRLQSLTKPGDIVLFHCCQRHEKETRQILPLYCGWLKENGWKSEKINI